MATKHVEFLPENSPIDIEDNGELLKVKRSKLRSFTSFNTHKTFDPTLEKNVVLIATRELPQSNLKKVGLFLSPLLTWDIVEDSLGYQHLIALEKPYKRKEKKSKQPV